MLRYNRATFLSCRMAMLPFNGGTELDPFVVGGEELLNIIEHRQTPDWINTLKWSCNARIFPTCHGRNKAAVRYMDPSLDPQVSLLTNSKRKTEIVKDTVNPVFDETFEYTVAPFFHVFSCCLA
ncbi:Synaptotagmin 2 variant 2-like protein [Daphnia magna]|uniref:Synaptotagmin 2 variant 2-like protein n=1 Tax=Daphnia magna TaxID=35525 RepID=A0A162PQE7_9CRUS|nr:Synaptotagmin 2 variant 2-like protein [Daphnia magna]